MNIDRVTLIGSDDSVHRSLSAVVVRSVTPAEQSLVLEAPHDALDGAETDVEADHGRAVVVTTTEGLTYDGYVEVVADGIDSRFYWCAIGF